MSTVQSISSPAKVTVDTINLANAAITYLDTIDNVYLQPFRTFNTIVDGIANVRSSN